MTNRYLEVLKNNRSAMVALVTAIILPIAYNNCSAKMMFEASPESRIEALNTSGAIVINNGDEFTKSTSVTLGISHATADQMYVTNDPKCETGGVWEPLAAIKPWTLGTVNTNAAVYVKFSNDGMLSGDCLDDVILHDDIPPALSVATAPAAFTSADDVSAALVATDSGSGVGGASCSGTSKPATCSPSTLSITAAVEGSHSYSVIVSDRAGNTSAPRNVSFVVDRTKPTVALNLMPSKISNQTGSKFEFTGSDALSGIDRFECRAGLASAVASASYQTCVSGMTTNSVSGSQRFEVRAVDRAGNVSTVVSYDWIIDLGAPTVTITKTPGAYSNQTQAIFEFIGTDDSGPLASFTCKIDNDAATPCTSPYTSKSGLTEGSHTFTVIGRDIAGNLSSPAIYTWVVDATAPTITITSKPAPITSLKNADFVLSANDGSSGVESLECQIDGGGFKPCLSTVSYAALTDGNRKFDARAKDRAGNVSAPATYSWAIDTSKPTLMITSGPAPWVNVKVASIAMDVKDTNAASGLPLPTIQCKLNSGAFAACVSPVSYSGLLETSFTFVARATDAAGNMSDDVTLNWGVDLTPPAINFGKQPMSPIYKNALAEIDFVATDSASGIASVMCGVDGVYATCTAAYSATLAALPVGNHKFGVIAVDKAGNEARREITWQVSDKTTLKNQLVDVKGSNKIDVLVVIDNSGSMATEHANMASRFGTFLDQLEGLDWQVGIVTTDVSSDAVKKDGRLVEFNDAAAKATGAYVIKSSMGTAAAKAWFAATIQMPTNGSSNEQGVAATLRAAQRSQQTSDAISLRNAALFRADAALAVLVVTDADETNPKGTEAQNKPETLISFIKTTWPSKPFSFHSIIVPIGDSVCKAKDGNEGYGYNYEAISKLTGGLLGTVCAVDYGAQLKDIGKSTSELVSSALLDCVPLDTDGDGKPDLQVTTANGSAAPAFTFDGLRVKFASPLPIGTNKLTYLCLAPL